MIEALMLKLCFTMEQLDQWKKELPEYSKYEIVASYVEENTDEICLFVSVEER